MRSLEDPGLASNMQSAVNCTHKSALVDGAVRISALSAGHLAPTF